MKKNLKRFAVLIVFGMMLIVGYLRYQYLVDRYNILPSPCEKVCELKGYKRGFCRSPGERMIDAEYHNTNGPGSILQETG